MVAKPPGTVIVTRMLKCSSSAASVSAYAGGRGRRGVNVCAEEKTGCTFTYSEERLWTHSRMLEARVKSGARVYCTAI